ncbi:hypothetical protein ACFQ07_34195 [Actinomadura adrarensis]|uniref:Uncharacterized protein n=1 Tax=Actinomadura adrarensis TaxID=1819600 RepID=A0ABW3CSW8_9ACTN
MRPAIITATATLLAAVLAASVSLYIFQRSQSKPQPKPTATGTAAVRSFVPQSRPTTNEPAWPGEPGGVLYITGSPAIEPGGDNSLDFDVNDLSWDVHAGEDADVLADDDGLGAQNGASFASVRGSAAPTLADCRSKGPSEWIPQIGVDEFKTPSIFCLRTNAGRFGYMKTKRVTFFSEREGNVNDFTLNFVLWKKPGDR